MRQEDRPNGGIPTGQWESGEITRDCNNCSAAVERIKFSISGPRRSINLPTVPGVTIFRPGREREDLCARAPEQERQ